MRWTLFAAFALVIVAPSAHTFDEYVNPVFCYRIVLPKNVTRQMASKDGGGEDLDLTSNCQGNQCIHLHVGATYTDPTASRSITESKQNYLANGWIARSQGQQRANGWEWHKTVLQKHYLSVAFFDHENAEEQVRYYVIVQYPTAKETEVRVMIHDLLDSWRLISECV